MKNTIGSLIKDEWYYTSRFLYRFRWFRKSTGKQWTKLRWRTGRIYWLPIPSNVISSFTILDTEDWSN